MMHPRALSAFALGQKSHWWEYFAQLAAVDPFISNAPYPYIFGWPKTSSHGTLV